MANQINPMNEYSIHARNVRCRAYFGLSRYTEMKSDLDELRRLQKLGLVKGLEREIEVLSAMYQSVMGTTEKRDFEELVAQGLATIQTVSTSYDPRQSIDWNVNALLCELKQHLGIVSKLPWRMGKINKHFIPVVCSCRQSADVLVHLVFTVAEQTVFPRIMPGEPSRVTVLRISDTMKNPLVLSHEQRQWVTRKEEFLFQILDQTDDFLPSEGFIIAYHLVLDCELCSPCLFRWIISEGVVVHSDRQQIANSSEFLSDIEFLPSLFEGGQALVGDVRWSGQVDVCRRLYNLLLGGLESFYSSVECLIFVPDRHLFRISFGSLLSRDGSYLIERHAVSVSSSIRLLRLNQAQKTRLLLREDLASLQIGALVCGNAMNGKRISDSATEINKIVRFLLEGCSVEDEIVVLNRGFFDPLRLFESCQRFHPRIVHVVAHGCATDTGVDENSDILEQFRIHGQMDCSNGAVISARDVAWKYDLSGTDLVFLNSCSVGYGKLQKSGVLGFNNAIFQAGCPSVISSLWQVNPGLSNELAKRFYRFYLVHHFDKADSLRYAILGLLRDRQWVKLGGVCVRLRASPALWGSFQLFGNPM